MSDCLQPASNRATSSPLADPAGTARQPVSHTRPVTAAAGPRSGSCVDARGPPFCHSPKTPSSCPPRPRSGRLSLRTQVKSTQARNGTCQKCTGRAHPSKNRRFANGPRSHPPEHFRSGPAPASHAIILTTLAGAGAQSSCAWCARRSDTPLRVATFASRQRLHRLRQGSLGKGDKM